MKRTALWLAAVVLLCAVTACAARGASGQAPVLTQQVTGLVLSYTGREMVLQTTQDGDTELRAIAIQGSVAADVNVGDTVCATTQLHTNNTETLCEVQVLESGALTQEQAAALLPSTRRENDVPKHPDAPYAQEPEEPNAAAVEEAANTIQ